jgi:hypothetical protein
MTKGRHPWQTHGGYSLLRRVAVGSLDGRTRNAAAIRATRQQLAVDLGSTWDELPLQQRLLVEQVAVKATVLGAMAEYGLASGIVDPDGKLWSPLGDHYLAWSNSLRLDLQALGLERKAKDVIDIATVLARMPEGRGERPHPKGGSG